MKTPTDNEKPKYQNDANCNAKISTGLYVFLVVAAILAAIAWLIF
ncbi:hypothetical protein [Parapedobacter tibetensis]|nr:hypothetical protein [Parapedobacter tibetensis]